MGKGDKGVLTIDLNGFVPSQPENDIQGVPGKVTVEFHASAAPKPTFNGVEMTANGSNYIAESDLN